MLQANIMSLEPSLGPSNIPGVCVELVPGMLGTRCFTAGTRCTQAGSPVRNLHTKQPRKPSR